MVIPFLAEPPTQADLRPQDGNETDEEYRRRLAENEARRARNYKFQNHVYWFMQDGAGPHCTETVRLASETYAIYMFVFMPHILCYVLELEIWSIKCFLLQQSMKNFPLFDN